MAESDVSRHGMWSSRTLFILAAVGSAVGLGNIWRFPYITGENGGGAFVVLYLLCIAAVGIPVMMAEVMLGRQGRQSPINTMRSLAQQSDAWRGWSVIGWMGALGGFLILSYYSVVAGWALYYIYLLASGTFVGTEAAAAGAAFDAFLANPGLLVGFHTLFMVITVFIVGAGVVAGLERAIRWFMPLLFVLLGVLLVYGATEGDFAAGFNFMFSWNWEKLTADGVLEALGHAFFTLSVGMGAIMAYGSYMPNKASIPSAVVVIGLLDTLVAIAAGLAIFAIVFANGLEPGQGPGLLFVTVPIAFGNMGLGVLFGTLFFILVTFAAITSAISIIEPAMAFAVEEFNARRWHVALVLGLVCWILGLGTVFSFNAWADVHVVGEMTFFDFFDFVTQKVMLPLGGLLIAVFAAWVLPKTVVDAQLRLPGGGPVELLWQVLIEVAAPLGVFAVFAYTLYHFFSG
ncbi:MAG: sodium-dependent transporter [Gammaproteobacteria bacterium]|nr:sodium-dependent transporter [Gammaproteobacteria bacterium]